MADIPEHLLKRAKERRDALANKGAETDETPTQAATPAAAADSGGGGYVPKDPSGKIPAHLLARSAAKKGAGAESAGAPAGASAAPPATSAAATSATSGMVGPGGHTQRLLTVVKAGSIQETKSSPVDKVNVWPHLLVIEFVAALGLCALLIVVSVFVNAPLLALANVNRTPNPSKAPWYFLGLQELLTMFHPMVAGVTIPGVGLGLLALAPYIDKNPSDKPEDRKFAFSLMVMFLMFWAVLVIIGSFFRGEGFNFILPWQQGIHEIFDL